MERGFARVIVVAAALMLPSVAMADAPDANQPTPAQTAHHKKKRPKKQAAPKASNSCASDDDCAFTAFEDGACCPMLCPPRIVNKRSADAFTRYGESCKKPEGGCPVPECAPPRVTMTAACVSGKCVARAAPGQTRE